MDLLRGGILLILLPIALMGILFLFVMPLASKRYKSINKETREQVVNERNKIFNEKKERSKNQDTKERLSNWKLLRAIWAEVRKDNKRIRKIRLKGAEKARRTIENEYGIDDIKKENKEIINELKTNDIRDLFQ